jgi:preprotein translocase subunit SecG
MKLFVLIGQIITALSLSALILLQAKGTGLGSAFGGGGEFYRSKRGVEKIVFIATIVFGVLFLLFSIANLVVG